MLIRLLNRKPEGKKEQIYYYLKLPPCAVNLGVTPAVVRYLIPVGAGSGGLGVPTAIVHSLHCL